MFRAATMGLLWWIGVVVLAYSFLKVISYVTNFYNLYFTESKLRYQDFGKWAVVTGCTNGIGLEFARQLAQCGLNIVLVSRNKEKLKKVKDEIMKEFKNIECKIVVMDFTKSNEDHFQHLKEKIKDLQIGILINNAGMATKHPFFLPNLKHEGNNGDVMSCNLHPIDVIEAVLPNMIKRNKGLVVNISTISVLVQIGALSLYVATKKFLNNFTLSLAVEYESSNILFQSVTPGFVKTNMTDMVHGKLPWYVMCDAQTFVQYCLRAIGKQNIICGYWTHELQRDITSLFPEFLIPYIISKFGKREIEKKFEHQ